MQTYLIVALVSYLLGSIPFGYILVRLFLKQDIRETGSGNIGATNVARSGAKGLAILTLVLDSAKGFVAVLFATTLWVQLGGRPNIDCVPCIPLGKAAMLAALFAVLGHMFPVWLRFKGGKGVATALGALVIIDAAAVIECMIVFGIVVAITRYVSLGSVIAAALYPIAMLFGFTAAQPSLSDIWPVMLISALVILKHHANIRRLLAGTEPKLGAKPIPPPQEMEKQV